MGAHPGVDAHYRPARRTLPDALAEAGVGVEDVKLVVSCHLHFDHCGGNPQLVGQPIVTQRLELEAARSADYTVMELIDAPGLRYEELEGEAEILPGVLVVPTPGHTAGHQSLVVHAGDGTVVVTGQSHDMATAYRRRSGVASGQGRARVLVASHAGLDRPAPAARSAAGFLRPRQRRLATLTARDTSPGAGAAQGTAMQPHGQLRWSLSRVEPDLPRSRPRLAPPDRDKPDNRSSPIGNGHHLASGGSGHHL
jgi:glyoxylase-like metal-dependent hydrolase (beta-lactamase superfamily II)